MSIFKKITDNNRREIRSDSPDKKGIFLFWELFTRKFWNYIILNLLYVLTSIVSLAYYWLVLAIFVVPVFVDTISAETLNDLAVMSASTPDMFRGSVVFFLSCFGALLLVTFFGGGVCSAGFNYILRNYARQENAYIFADFFGQTRKNFGQALILSVIDKILVSVCLFSIAYYFGDIIRNGSTLSILAFAVLLFAFLMYAAMHTYLWTIMVTFNVTIKQLFKNAFVLTMGTAARSVCYMLCLAVFIIVSLMLFAYSPMPVAFAFLLILISVVGIASHLFSYPVIKKYMIDNNNENQKGTEA